MGKSPHGFGLVDLGLLGADDLSLMEEGGFAILLELGVQVYVFLSTAKERYRLDVLGLLGRSRA